MTYKNVPIDAEVHRQLKIAAAVQGEGIREFAEKAILARLGAFSLADAVKESTEAFELSIESPTPEPA